MAQPNNVLVLAYLFPPAGGVGVQRVLSFVRYLPASGCTVRVLTAANPAVPALDPSLAARVPAGTAVSSAWTPEPSYETRERVLRWLGGNRTGGALTGSPEGSKESGGWKRLLKGAIERVLCPDPQRFWVPFAVRKARRIVREEGIGTILVSAPPFSSLQAGVVLKREFPELKLVSDFRDEWVGHFLRLDRAASEWKKQRILALEREAVEASDFVVTVTPPWVEEIRGRYPGERPGKFICVPNGYDPEMFGAPAPTAPGGQRFRITYAGSVYDNEVYSPRAFLDAFDSLPERMKERIEVRIAGRVAPEARGLFAPERKNVRLLGFVPQSEAFGLLKESTCLLLIFGSAEGHSGKLFEYLATGRPILGLTPPGGEIARLLRETRAGWTAPQNDSGAIRDLLEKVFTNWELAGEGGELTSPDWEAIRRYERPRLAGQLAKMTGMTAL